MNETGLVHGGKGAAQVESHQCRFAGADRTTLQQLLLEGAAREELHGDSDDAVDDIRAIDGDDVRVPQPGDQPAFGDDAVAGHGGAGAAGQQLEGDIAIQADIARPVDDTEAALADLFE